ncbi:hypothetical protein ABC270_12145 [Curtobacterium sp. 1P10AnD]|uniref:aggregation-promoting factor C-terminal-like domain-containing protein n=1 Tax=Curtobacterium sp. 1P10AnD TaxID=3132283 RepID=UPI00399FC38D
MGRHTADSSSDRDPREHLDRTVSGERRAALNRTRTGGTAVLTGDPSTRATAPQTVPEVTGPVLVAPKSVAANRVSDATVAHAVPSTPADPRIVKQRRARVTSASLRSKPAHEQPIRGVNSFMRKRATIPALSFFAVFGFVGGSLFNPMQPDVAQAAVQTAVLAKAPAAAPQQYSPHGTYAAFDAGRDGYDVSVPKPKVTKAPTDDATADADSTDDSSTTQVSATNTLAPAAVAPDPGSAQAEALRQVTARGWGTDQYNCLVQLWNGESGWRVDAANPSGAYGIPQALPGSKMSSAGADWQTNPATQITWGLNYIAGIYGTPCGAWGTWNARYPHWY